MTAHRTPHRTGYRTGKTRMDTRTARAHGLFPRMHAKSANAHARLAHARVTHAYTYLPVRPCGACAGAGFARAVRCAVRCAVCGPCFSRAPSLSLFTTKEKN